MKLLRRCVYFCAFLAAILPEIGQAQAPGTWQFRNPIPTGRYGSPSAVIDGKLFVAGGCCQNPFAALPARFNTLSVYDPVADSWSLRTPIPIPLYAAANGVIDGKWYLAGGSPCCQNIAALQIYDPLIDQWSSGAPMPEANSAGAGGVINGELVVAGGSNPANTQPVASVRIYNPVSNTWRSGAAMPAARNNTAGAVVGERLYVIGGGDASGVFNDLFIYDAPTNSWTVGPSMPTARYLLGAAALDGKIYAVGGSDNVNWLTVVEVFDPLTGQWTTAAAMPNAHGLPAIGAIGKDLYVVGGANGATPVSTTNDVFVFDPSKITPAITVFGGTSTYNGFSHPATASALDAGNAVPGSFTFTYTPGGPNPPITPGTYQVAATFTPQNPSGYSAAAGTGSITINPSVAVVNAPNSVSAEATGPAGAAPVFFVTAFDFDGPLTPVCSPFGPGATFPLGPTQVTCTAHGAHSTQGSTTFPVTITDTHAPIIGSVSNVTAAATSSQGANVTFTLPSVSDTVDPHPTISASPASDSLFPHGATTVTVTARDASGNTSSNTFTVTVTATLVSISVSPATATMSLGNNRQFSALGLFTDGSSRQIQSGSGGGGGGGGGNNNGPGNFPWEVRFLPTFPVGACTPVVVGGLSSQGLGPVTGNVDMGWGPGNFLHVTGTITPASVSLNLACTTGASPAPPVLTLTAAWAGTRYEGSFTGYGGVTVNVRITGWSSKAAMPSPRFALGAATLHVNGHDIVYAVGGATANALLSIVDAYDPALDAWSPAPPLPVAREGAGVVAVNNLLYVVGGNASGGIPTGRVDVFDPLANAWLNTLPPLTVPRAHFSLVAAGNALYAIGGDIAPNNTTVTGSVERLDLTQPALGWTAMAPMPTPRRFTAAGALNAGGLIAVVGGSEANGPALNRTELYNVAANSWAQGAPILAATAGAASAVVQNALFVFGGTNNGALTLAELYRPAAGQQLDYWASLGGLPTARAEAAAAVIGDVIYVAGGQTGNPASAMATLEAFSILEPDQFSASPGTGSGGGGGGGTNPTVTWRLSPGSGVATISPSGNAFGSAPGQVTVIAESAAISCVTTSTCATLTVVNTPPSVSIFGGSQTIDAGSAYSGSGAFFDPDNGQSWTATVDYGDESGLQSLALTPGTQPGPRGTFTLAHVYAHPGHFTVSVTVNDSAGAPGSASTPVRVVDHDPPLLSLPGALAAEATGPNGAAVRFSVGALDTIDGNVPVSCDRATGSTFPIGTTTVHCSAADLSGNSADGSFTVTVTDTTAPAIASVTPSVPSLWPPNHKMVPVTFAVQAADLVDPGPVCEVVAVASSEAADALGDGHTAVDWTITPGSLTVMLRAERSGTGGGRIYTITVRCRDAAGNAATATAEVGVAK